MHVCVCMYVVYAHVHMHKCLCECVCLSVHVCMWRLMSVTSFFFNILFKMSSLCIPRVHGKTG